MTKCQAVTKDAIVTLTGLSRREPMLGARIELWLVKPWNLEEPTTAATHNSVSSTHAQHSFLLPQGSAVLTFFFFSSRDHYRKLQKLFKMQRPTDCGCPDPTDRSTTQSLHPRLKNILEKEGILRDKGP